MNLCIFKFRAEIPAAAAPLNKSQKFETDVSMTTLASFHVHPPLTQKKKEDETRATAGSTAGVGGRRQKSKNPPNKEAKEKTRRHQNEMRENRVLASLSHEECARPPPPPPHPLPSPPPPTIYSLTGPETLFATSRRLGDDPPPTRLD